MSASKRREGESSRRHSERLARDIYKLQIKYLKVVNAFNINDRKHVASLAALHKAIIDMAVMLARAVLDARTESTRIGRTKKSRESHS